MIELTDEQRRAVAAAGDTPSAVAPPPFRVPEGIRRSRAAIRRDLPSLLRKRGKFVCYRGDERVGIGEYRTLMAECNRRGFRDDEFVIELIGAMAGSEEEEEIDRRPEGPDEEPA
jgi:hypothetical protein